MKDAAGSWIACAARLSLPFRRAPLARRRPEIEENASAQGTLRRRVADHIAIHGGRRDRPIEHELDVRPVSWGNGLVAEQNNARA